MFPIGDDNPTRRVPYVTYALIAINLLVFVYELMLQNQLVAKVPYVDPATGKRLVNAMGELAQKQITGLDYFFDNWAVVPAQLTASFTGQAIRSTLPRVAGVASIASEPPEILTLISSQFLHGGWSHLLGNMLFLWIFGNNIEDKLGRAKYVLFYLGCGVLAGLSQWFFSMGSFIPSLGASGAIAGVMGAYIIRFPKVPIKTIIPPIFVFDVPAFLYLAIWFVQQAFYSFASLGPPAALGMESGGVAYWAHAGGFVFGAILGTLLGLFKDYGQDGQRNDY